MQGTMAITLGWVRVPLGQDTGHDIIGGVGFQDGFEGGVEVL